MTAGSWNTGDETIEWATDTRLDRLGIWGARLGELGRRSTTGDNV